MCHFQCRMETPPPPFPLYTISLSSVAHLCQPAPYIRNWSCGDMEGKENVFLEILESPAGDGRKTKVSKKQTIPSLHSCRQHWSVLYKEMEMHCALDDKLNHCKGNLLKRLKQCTLKTKHEKSRGKYALQSLLYTEGRKSIWEREKNQAKVLV